MAFQSFFAPIIMSLATLLLVGIVLLVVGFRGKKINDHPICKKCKFDLVGIYPDHTRCPECGTALSTPRAILQGARKRRKASIATGLALMLVSLSLSVLAGVVIARSLNVYAYLPDSVLMVLVEYSNANRRQNALTELTARISNNQLSDQRIETLVDKALTIQADPNAQWLPQWGDIIDQAIANKKIQPSQIKEYLVHAIDIQLSIPKNAAAASTIPVGFILRMPRGGSRTAIIAEILSDHMQLFDTSGRQVEFSIDTIHSIPFVSSGGSAMLSRNIVLDVEPGKYRLASEVDIHLGIASTQSRGLPARPYVDKKHLETTMDVVPKDTRFVKYLPQQINQAAIDQQMKIGITLTNLVISTPGHISYQFNYKNLPVSSAFEIKLRQDNQDHHIGTIYFPRSGQGEMSSVDVSTDWVNSGSPITIILQSSLDVAESLSAFSSAYSEIWQGRIIFENVQRRLPIKETEEAGASGG